MLRILTIVALLLLTPATAAADAHWEVWRAPGWQKTSKPGGTITAPLVQKNGARQCRGFMMRLVTHKYLYRNQQCIRVIDYDYWCKYVQEASLVVVDAKDAPACGPTQSVDCKKLP